VLVLVELGGDETSVSGTCCAQAVRKRATTIKRDEALIIALIEASWAGCEIII